MENGSKLFIKGMVCNRCVMVVEEELKGLGHEPVQVSLGAATVRTSSEQVDKAALEQRLQSLGFSLLQDPKTQLVGAVKALVAEVYSGSFDFPEPFRFSELVSKRLQKPYETISDVFVALEKQTIEQYLIAYRINKVKEYLVYTPQTLADIAFRLNFNSVAHLSTQFKQQTGLTPSFFREIQKNKEDVKQANP